MSSPTLSSTFLPHPKKVREYGDGTPFYKIFNVDPEVYKSESKEVYENALNYLEDRILNENPSVYTLAYYTLEILGAEKTAENYLKLLAAFEIATRIAESKIIKDIEEKVMTQVAKALQNAFNGEAS